MQTVSDLFKSKIKEASREFECKITIGDRVFTNEDLVDIKLSNGLQSEGFMIGATPSAMLDLTLLNRGDIIYSTNQIKIEIGLNIGSKFEYLLMGKFNIDEVEKTDYTVKFTAYDNMIKFETAYFSALGDNPTLQQVVNELASKTGVQFTGTLPTCNVKKLEGFTCREVLGYVASLCGGNAFITRDGKFTIVVPKESNYSITTDNYFDYKREEVIYKVGKVSCQVGEEIISKGTLGIDNMELQFENPWITPTILTDIYNKLKTFNYLGYNMKWQGDISLDLGDIVTVTDIKGVSRKVPILNMKFTYTGGLTSEIEAKGETKNKNSFSPSGSNSNKINRLVTEQAVIKEALIEKANIEDLKATNAEIANLKVKDTEIENALIKKATIEQLNATNANIQNLIAEDARINNLVASKASLTELNAVSAKISTVEADTAIIKDLLAGNVTAGSGQIIHLTAKNVTIEDAVIKNLIAAKLSVADLMAGTINTNKFTIASTDGGLNIVGPTMQFKDKNNKVRIQMGQDTQGNFNFILRGADGTTTLIDHTGIKEKAIADKLIKSNMVADNAIGEQQINYSSLITGINKDTNTQLIKASKVAIDLEGQTLEVAFNSLKSNVDSGNTNIYRYTNLNKDIMPSKTIGWYSANGAKGNTEILDEPTALSGKKTKTTYTTQGLHGLYLRLIDNTNLLTIGTYTISMYVRGTPGFVLEIMQEGVSNSSITTTLTGEWVKVSKTFSIAAGNVNLTTPKPIHFYKMDSNANIGDWFEVHSIKLERGEKVTEWCNNERDISSTTTSLQTKIAANNGKIEALIKDTTITEGSTSTTLKDAYISLKATVNGLNSTVASHESSITTVKADLGKVDGKINIAKADAISTAGADATSKANNALDSAKSYTNAQITTVNTRVSNAESSITQLNNSITNKVWQTDIDKTISKIEIGGRNLLINSPDENNKIKQTAPKDDGYAIYYNIYCNLEKGVEYIVNGKTDGKWVNKHDPQNPNPDVVTIWLTDGASENYLLSIGTPFKVNNTKKFLLRLNVYKKGTTHSFWDIQVEKGNKVTSYTKAPEDIDKNIDTVSKEVTTVKEKAATLETNLSGITSKVTNLESTTSTISGKVNAQETRLQSTEQKVTAKGVITTITEAINAGTNSLSTMQFILDKNGTTIKNGALKILNTAGDTVFNVDTDGNALVKGNLETHQGSTWAIKANGTTLLFNDWEGGIDKAIGSFYSSRTNYDASKPTLTWRHEGISSLSVAYRASDSYYSYLDFDYGNTLGDTKKNYPIRFRKGIDMRSAGMGTQYSYSRVYEGSGSRTLITDIYTGQRNMGGWALYDGSTNNMIMSARPGDVGVPFFQFNQTAQFKYGVTIASLNVTGTKQRIIETEEYGTLGFNAYETATPYFGDIGRGKTNKEGICVIHIDELFKEGANTDIEYEVFLQKRGKGDIWIKESNSLYFIVEGTPSLEFSWELKAIQRDYEEFRYYGKDREVNRNEIDWEMAEANKRKVSRDNLVTSIKNIEEINKNKYEKVKEDIRNEVII